MNTYTLDTLIDKHIGTIGTVERNEFELNLQLDVIANKIKEIRLKQNLTQEQLGCLIGVKKAQISKLENGINNVRINTLLKVFRALNSNLKFKVETEI